MLTSCSIFTEIQNGGSWNHLIFFQPECSIERKGLRCLSEICAWHLRNILHSVFYGFCSQQTRAVSDSYTFCLIKKTSHAGCLWKDREVNLYPNKCNGITIRILSWMKSASAIKHLKCVMVCALGIKGKGLSDVIILIGYSEVPNQHKVKHKVG